MAMIESLEGRELLAAIVMRDVNPGPAGAMTGAFRASTVFASRGLVYFDATDGVHPVTVWVTDGTPRGTRPLRADLGGAGAMVELRGRVLFTRRGGQLWTTDGTHAGTTLVARLPRTAGGDPPFIDLFESSVVDGRRLVFVAGEELWTTDGTPGGTHALYDVDGRHVDSPSGPATRAFFISVRIVNAPRFDLVEHELWVTDGTAAGTRLVRPLGDEQSLVYGWTDEAVVVKRITADGDPEYLVGDGTTARMRRVEDPHAFLARARGERFFFTYDARRRKTLWHVAAGGRLRKLRTFAPDEDGFGGMMHGREFYFPATTETHGEELWKSDGTRAGTVMVADVNTGGGSSHPSRFTAVRRGRLAFFADDGVYGTSVWSTDGKATRRLATVGQPGGYVPMSAEDVIAGRWYFALDGVVWKTDGTAAGTKKLGEFYGGRSHPNYFSRAGDRVIFRAQEPRFGNEFWMDEDELD